MNPNRIEIEVRAWSGNSRPWKSVVRLDGKIVGTSGFCSTEYRARLAGERIARAALAKEGHAVGASSSPAASADSATQGGAR